MWICSKYGFFSIVKKQDGFHVRARLRQDLCNLCLAAGVGDEIQEWPAADYRWRVRLNSDAMAILFVALAQSIDYPNFKSMIAGLSDQAEKLSIYGDLWQRMAHLQR